MKPLLTLMTLHYNAQRRGQTRANYGVDRERGIAHRSPHCFAQVVGVTHPQIVAVRCSVKFTVKK